jgi:hypothetical protein
MVAGHVDAAEDLDTGTDVETWTVGFRQGVEHRVSQVALGGYPPCCDSFEERLVVALVLVGVGGGEAGDGLVEDVRAAQVRGDGDPIAGAGGRGPVPTRRPRRMPACRA